MTVAPPTLMPVERAPASPALGRAGATAATILCLALLALLVVTVRVFVFLHFHGDSGVVDGLFQLLRGNLGF